MAKLVVTCPSARASLRRHATDAPVVRDEFSTVSSMSAAASAASPTTSSSPPSFSLIRQPEGHGKAGIEQLPDGVKLSASEIIARLEELERGVQKRRHRDPRCAGERSSVGKGSRGSAAEGGPMTPAERIRGLDRGRERCGRGGRASPRSRGAGARPVSDLDSRQPVRPIRRRHRGLAGPRGLGTQHRVRPAGGALRRLPRSPRHTSRTRAR